MHRSHLPLAILGLLSTVACTRAPAGSEQVALRLRARDFGHPTARHAPMLAIGKTAREVIALPKRNRIAMQSALFVDGVARMEIPAPPLPAGATVELEVQGLGLKNRVERNVRARIARGGRFVRLERGWALEPSSEGHAQLVVERAAVRAAVPEEQDDRQVVARVFVRRPIPARLTSRPFRMPPRATRVEIPYGVLGTAPAGADARPVDVRATLDCGEQTYPLLHVTITPGRDAPGWRSAHAALPGAATSCRIELAQSTATGDPSAFVVWGAPRLTTRDDRSALRIVLISLDTLRADHVSGYGYPRRTTPEIDRRLIDRGVRFADAITTISSTGIAHMSLFTGLYPRDQRSPGRLDARDAADTLAERLQQAGFTTAAFTEDGLIAGPFGFWFGFDTFREYPVVSAERGIRVFDDGISFLREHRDGRFFLFLHTYKVHDPWVFGAATHERFRDGSDWADGTLDRRIPGAQRDFVDAYDRTIVEVDRMVARFLDELDRLGLADDTLVVLLSDHGEAFGEHRILGHGFGFQREQLHIPLVFRGPGIGTGAVREPPVSIADVATTILDLAGTGRDAVLGSGRSLAALVRAGTASRDVALAERPLFFTWLLTEADGARLGPVKLVRDPHHCRRYDLRTDPLEEHPTAVPCEEAPLARRIDAYRSAARARFAHRGPAARSVALPPETENSLRTLGYLE